ncbi:MAG: PA0069 family radical SAM protein [Archangium sp.]|nr:PA0069 family radical SAM protein [Archangium sp.]MDP3572523.1 PA0069 family radical SAM protein [Archangium sp.]
MKPQAIANPPNPWATTEVEYLEEVPLAKVELFDDHSQTIVAKNDSPDVGFSYSVNPYRGCNHACAYCFARPSHEYLSWGAGTDFDTKIVVKREAARLLRLQFERPSWKGDLVMFSGVTDCYQPTEAALRLTRSCLEVCAEYRNPVAIITKAPLIERDLDVLWQLHRDASVHVSISIPIWDPELARAIEPGVATPKRRIQAIERLAKAGIPVGVMVAPIIPGVSDEGMARVLEAARNAGATSAGYVLLRLPGSVKDVFESRIKAALPLRAEKILHRVRETRNGKLYDHRFGVRGRGEGPYADAIEQVFDSCVKRLGFNNDERWAEHPSTFRRPPRVEPQMALF